MPQYKLEETRAELISLLDTYDKQSSFTFFNTFSSNLFSFHGQAGKKRSAELRNIVNDAQDANELLCQVSMFVYNTMIKDNSSTLMSGAASILCRIFNDAHRSGAEESDTSVNLPAASILADKNKLQQMTLQNIFNETQPKPMVNISSTSNA